MPIDSRTHINKVCRSDIFQAMYEHETETLRMLLQGGAALQTLCEHKKLYDFYGRSPLACALLWFEELPGVAELLLEAGADPNYRSPDGGTAFAAGVAKDFASCYEERYARLLEQMLSSGWNLELPSDKEGNTPLSLACRHIALGPGKVSARFLLEHGADANAANLAGQTPLMLLYGGHAAPAGMPPYGWSVDGEAEAVLLRRLLEAGTDAGRRDNRGNTFLHYLAASCGEEGTERALEAFAGFSLPDIGAVNNEGLTAMDVAAEWDNERLVELLLEQS